MFNPFLRGANAAVRASLEGMTAGFLRPRRFSCIRWKRSSLACSCFDKVVPFTLILQRQELLATIPGESVSRTGIKGSLCTATAHKMAGFAGLGINGSLLGPSESMLRPDPHRVSACLWADLWTVESRGHFMESTGQNREETGHESGTTY